MKTRFLNRFIFIFSLLATNSFINLYLKVTDSPDWGKYARVLGFFIGGAPTTQTDQGLLYYFIIHIFNLFNFDKLNPNSLELSWQFYNHYIHFGNFFIYLFGLVGYYKLILQYEIDKEKAYFILSVINIFPPTIMLRIFMKPELLAFSLLPYIIFLINIFKMTNDLKYLYIAALPISLILISKGSIFAMTLILLFFMLFREVRIIGIKTFSKFLLLLFIIFSMLIVESSILNDRNFLSHNTEENYLNKADLSLIYNLNLNLFSNKTYESGAQSNSLIGIVISDTFGDYFDVFWDYDSSKANLNRIELISKSDTNIYFIKIFDNTIKIGGIGYYFSQLDYFRSLIGILLTVLFYNSLIKTSLKTTYNKIYLLAPFIGILVLTLNSFGIPSLNYDPLKSDTLKSHYYGFLLVISLIYLLIYNLKNINFKNIFTLFLYSVLFFFILGFPKNVDNYYHKLIYDDNLISPFCEINKLLFIPFTKIDNTENRNCLNKHEIKCKDFDYYFVGNREGTEYLMYKNEDIKVMITNYTDCIKYSENGYNFLKFRNSGYSPVNLIERTPIASLGVLFFSIYYFFLNRKKLENHKFSK